MLEEVEYETKLKLNKEQYQELIDSNLINEIFGKKIESELIVQKDHYFDTDSEKYKKNQSILRVRELINKKYNLTHKIKLDDKNIEKQQIISFEEFIELQNFGKITSSKQLEMFDREFFCYGKVQKNAEIETKRIRYKLNKINVDVDQIAFLNLETSYEVEVEATSKKESEKIISMLKEELKINKFEKSMPKIARYFILREQLIKTFPYKKIIVVEGKSDTNKLRTIFPEIMTFETSGLGLTEDMMLKFQKVVTKNKLQPVVFTDPDLPGKKIRKIFSDQFPNILHAYLSKDKAISKNKRKIGVEHASDFDILESLTKLKYKVMENNGKWINYTLSDLLNWGVYGNQKKRNQLCEKLNISSGNNKAILRQINEFQISQTEIEEVIKELA